MSTNKKNDESSTAGIIVWLVLTGILGALGLYSALNGFGHIAFLTGLFCGQAFVYLRICRV